MKQELIDKVIEQIKKDVNIGDYEALDEFLNLIYSENNKRYYVGYLSDVNESEYPIKYYGEDFEPGY